MSSCSVQATMKTEQNSLLRVQLAAEREPSQQYRQLYIALPCYPILLYTRTMIIEHLQGTYSPPPSPPSSSSSAVPAASMLPSKVASVGRRAVTFAFLSFLLKPS